MEMRRGEGDKEGRRRGKHIPQNIKHGSCWTLKRACLPVNIFQGRWRETLVLLWSMNCYHHQIRL